MKKNILKAFAGDMMYSIIALVALNGTIQLLVNPLLTKQMGAAAFGVILSIESVVSIMASSFGSGANYSRLVMSARKEEPKGDYNLFLAIIAAISLIVTLVMLIVFRALNPVMYVSSAVLMIASVLRYYGDVQYKLSINYKGFMKYYIVIAIGYAAGTLRIRSPIRGELLLRWVKCLQRYMCALRGIFTKDRCLKHRSIVPVL